jgi:hypothetical protein
VLREADSMLLGRATYDGFAAAWASRSGDPFADKFNATPKHVVSATLERADWNNGAPNAPSGSCRTMPKRSARPYAGTPLQAAPPSVDLGSGVAGAEVGRVHAVFACDRAAGQRRA